MREHIGPVAGLVVRQFIGDGAYWGDAWMEDEEFVENGRVSGYREFEDTAQVSVSGGDVYFKSGERTSLPEFFQTWLARQSMAAVVAVPPERRAELESLLSAHGFTFIIAPKSAG